MSNFSNAETLHTPSDTRHANKNKHSKIELLARDLVPKRGVNPTLHHNAARVGSATHATLEPKKRDAIRVENALQHVNNGRIPTQAMLD
jgi:hypothetical protein